MIINKNYYGKFNILFISLLLMSNVIVYGQKKMTFQNMQEDIDFLVQTIKEASPHLAIREQITNTNIRQEMDSLRRTVNEVKSFEEFYYLAQKILLLCQDQHDNFQPYYPEGMEKDNSFISDEAIEISKTCFSNYDRYFPGNSFYVDYADGEYFLSVTHYDKKGKFVLIPAGAKLLNINAIPIDIYVSNYNRPVDNSIRWDFIHNKYYTHHIYLPPQIGFDKNIDITYKMNDSIYTINYMGSQIAGNTSKDAFTPKVLYFQKDQILYIRIPEMNINNLDFYVQNILKYKEAEIKKIVIDIRSNGGGNDRVWMNVMSTIKNKPFSTKLKCYLRNSPAIKAYLPFRGIELNENDSFRIGIDAFSAIHDEEETQENNHPSLNYQGKMYVLVNDKCFSSALALSATCNREENMITVGQASGYIGGRGIMPLFFTLPHSKLIFSVSPMLDNTCVRETKDYYDHYVKMPVVVSSDETVFEINYLEERYSEFYLYSYDSAFKVILNDKR